MSVFELFSFEIHALSVIEIALSVRNFHACGKRCLVYMLG